MQKYWYDANGNVTQRINGSQTITMSYDAENRLITMGSAVTETHTYDGDGNRVLAVVNGVTSVYVGNYFEVTGGITKTYYYAGNVRVAEKSGGTLYFLLTDHLGSTATTTDANGNRVTELRYYPYGGARYNPGGQLTTYRFTGQRWDSGTALYFYNARWYDPVIGRFLQADTIVPQPGNPQAFNRYAYAANNPLQYTDPTGHAFVEFSGGGCWVTCSLLPVSTPTPPGVALAPVPQPVPTPHPIQPTGTPTPGSVIGPGSGSSLLPDYYFQGFELGGGFAYGWGAGVLEVWDFQHNQYAFVSSGSQMWTTPGWSATGVFGMGSFGENASSIQNFAGQADEFTAGIGFPVGAVPATVGLTAGTSANYSAPGAESMGASVSIGVGSQGPSASWAGTGYQILGQPIQYATDVSMASAIIQHQTLRGQFANAGNPLGTAITVLIVALALLK